MQAKEIPSSFLFCPFPFPFPVSFFPFYPNAKKSPKFPIVQNCQPQADEVNVYAYKCTFLSEWKNIVMRIAARVHTLAAS